MRAQPIHDRLARLARDTWRTNRRSFGFTFVGDGAGVDDGEIGGGGIVYDDGTLIGEGLAHQLGVVLVSPLQPKV